MTTTTEPLLKTELPLPGRRQGKVRDIYEAKTKDGQDVLLIIASDRISAFDVVMPNGIPQKGRVLTQISRFWFDMIAEHFGDKLEHHLLSTDADGVEGLTDEQRASIAGRVMVGKKCKVAPIECIVRGYITGSGWKEYQRSGTICGIELPKGLQQCEKLPQPIFTPSTKAEEGHDENISFEQTAEIVGQKTAEKLRDLSLGIYEMAHAYAAKRGIILADTKFEFGLPLDRNDEKIILIDEVLTPDSSRFWPASEYEVGRDQPSFDKQYVRNYLQSLVDKSMWDKQPPGPELPKEIVDNTSRKYIEAYEALTGKTLTD